MSVSTAASAQPLSFAFSTSTVEYTQLYSKHRSDVDHIRHVHPVHDANSAADHSYAYAGNPDTYADDSCSHNCHDLCRQINVRIKNKNMKSNNSVPRKIEIPSITWQCDPAASITIHTKRSIAPLLLWVAMLEEFCRRRRARALRPSQKLKFAD